MNKYGRVKALRALGVERSASDPGYFKPRHKIPVVRLIITWVAQVISDWQNDIGMSTTNPQTNKGIGA